jgi:hypothetical protein
MSLTISNTQTRQICEITNDLAGFVQLREKKSRVPHKVYNKLIFFYEKMIGTKYSANG